MPGRLRVGRSADLGDRTFFFEIIPDLLVITGYDGYLRDVNTAWQNAVGWSRQELLAMPFLEFIHPEDRTRMASELERVQKGIFMMFLESRFQCKDGTYKQLMWKAAGMPSRSKVYLLGREILQGRESQPRTPAGSQDPTAERRARQLDLVQDWLAAGSWEVDLATMRFWWSDAMARLLGYVPAESPASLDDATELAVPEDRERFLAAMREAISFGQATVELRLRRADGGTLPVRALMKALGDRGGSPKTLCGMVQAVAGDPPGAALPPAPTWPPTTQ